MSENLPYYLTGTHHWLTKDDALLKAAKHFPAIAVSDADGTWSVWFLSARPRRTLQPFVRVPEREHMLFEHNEIGIKAVPDSDPS